MALNITISSEITENSNPPTITIKSAKRLCKNKSKVFSLGIDSFTFRVPLAFA